MKIAFASEHPNLIGAFSGTPCYMFQALHKAAESLTFIETPAYHLENLLHDRGNGLSELRAAGEFLSRRLETLDVDVVVCLGSSMIPYLQTDKPVILWHDSTWFGVMQMDFDAYRHRYPLLYEWDYRVLERCDLVLYAADWVRTQTMHNYGISPQKIHTVPFGANMLPQSYEAVETFIHKRRNLPCRLTFLGVDWRGKGLPLAYDVCRRLNEHGVPSLLNVIGCEVEPIGLKSKIGHYTHLKSLTDNELFQLSYRSDPRVNPIGFLRKDLPADYARLCETLQNTHFLLHPTRFECFGIAMVEANAFGVPVLASDHYGPQTVIRNGQNGFRFDLQEYVQNAASVIEHLMDHPGEYQALAFQSYREQRDRLDWDRSVEQVFDLIETNIFHSGYLQPA